MLPPPYLTPREKQIVPYLVVGATRAEIAKLLGISVETVKVHTQNTLAKFGATSVRDGFIALRDYEAFYLKGMFKYFVHHVDTTMRLRPNLTDADLLTRVDVMCVADELTSFSEQYVSDGDLPAVMINGQTIDPVKVAARTYKFGITLSPPLTFGQSTQIAINTEFRGAFGQVEEGHYNRISEPTGQITFAVEFPPDFHPKEVVFSRTQGTAEPEEIAEHQVYDVPNRYEIRDLSPTYMALYHVRWRR